MKNLITGFDAFGGEATNPSELVIEALAVSEPEGVVTAVLPTSYRRAEELICDLIATHRPDNVLMLGLAARATAIRLEQVAQNMNNSRVKDNDGEVRQSRRIDLRSAASYPNTLPLSRMASIARQCGHDVEFSDDAGGFVCNHVFYTAARTVAELSLDTRCGFVHLPRITARSDTLTDVVMLIRSWIAEGFA